MSQDEERDSSGSMYRLTLGKHSLTFEMIWKVQTAIFFTQTHHGAEPPCQLEEISHFTHTWAAAGFSDTQTIANANVLVPSLQSSYSRTWMCHDPVRSLASHHFLWQVNLSARCVLTLITSKLFLQCKDRAGDTPCSGLTSLHPHNIISL